MGIVKPTTLSGFMELLPQNQMQLDRLIDTLKNTYALYGFAPLDTPIIESAEVLLAKGGGETEKQIYRLTKGDSELALRFDLTVPLAKFTAANYGSLSFPFRRYQIGKVYRGERAQRGRFREFYQADIDIIGDEKLDIMNDAEIPSIIYRSFKALGLSNFVIKINNRKLLAGFFEMIGKGESSAEILRAIDKCDKIGIEKVKEQLIKEGLDDKISDKLISFITFKGTNPEKLAYLKEINESNELFTEGINELCAIAEHMHSFGVPEEYFEIDFSIARGLDYYTGTVYETIIKNHPEIGSVCSGGRYDDLAGYYTNKKLPGVGISVGVTRLFYVLSEQNMIQSTGATAPADVIIIPMTEDFAPAVSAANELRNLSIRTQLYTEKKKFKARLSYADKLNIPFVILIGEDEIKSGKYTLKNMKDGSQSLLSLEEAASLITEFTKKESQISLICENTEGK
ncbi:MAG: histidine--tRNA ligase [Ruminococcaceae bacterium]|nr:histidine--tRNA ligase [Oscillospiraceae bacterium]